MPGFAGQGFEKNLDEVGFADVVGADDIDMADLIEVEAEGFDGLVVQGNGEFLILFGEILEDSGSLIVLVQGDDIRDHGDGFRQRAFPQAADGLEGFLQGMNTFLFVVAVGGQGGLEAADGFGPGETPAGDVFALEFGAAQQGADVRFVGHMEYDIVFDIGGYGVPDGQGPAGGEDQVYGEGLAFPGQVSEQGFYGVVVFADGIEVVHEYEEGGQGSAGVDSIVQGDGTDSGLTEGIFALFHFFDHDTLEFVEGFLVFQGHDVRHPTDRHPLYTVMGFLFCCRPCTYSIQ